MTRNPRCFVAMPFDGYADVWAEIKAAVVESGFECFRGDDPDLPGNVMEVVIKRIFDADIVVVDLSDARPNVLYELGVSHTLGIRTIMTCDQDLPIPFDVASDRVIRYQRSDLGVLKTALAKALKISAEMNPVSRYGPERPFMIPYQNPDSVISLRELLTAFEGARVRISIEQTGWKTNERGSDSKVFEYLSTFAPNIQKVVDEQFDPRHPHSNVIVIGSPRFNPWAEIIQKSYSLPFAFVSARSVPDAATRDESRNVTPDLRALRIVTLDGDELSASVDSWIGEGDGTGHKLGGTDSGILFLAKTGEDRRLLWLGGIHGRGTIGVCRYLQRNAGIVLEAMKNLEQGQGVCFLVRVRYKSESSDYDFYGITTDPPGKPISCTYAQNNGAPRAVLFDLGDVVLRFDRDRSYRAIAHLAGQSYQEVERRIKQSQLPLQYERGELTTETFCKNLAAFFPQAKGLRNLLPELWGDIFWPNYEMVEVLHHLKQSGVKLILVSNTNPLHFERVSKDYEDIVGLFDEKVLSYEVGSLKSDNSKKIFRAAIEKSTQRGVSRTEDMCYVDDITKYAATMRGLGVRSFVYRSHAHFVFWMRQQGFHVPTIIDSH